MNDQQNRSSSSWILDDAIVLNDLGRKHGAILLMLCAIAALARENFPDVTKESERFEQFLGTKMRRPNRVQVHNIFVPKRNQFFTFEYIIYKFLRCPLVHEGARLEATDPAEFAVCLDWDEIPHGIKVDGDNNRVIIGGELVLNILIDAIRN